MTRYVSWDPSWYVPAPPTTREFTRGAALHPWWHIATTTRAALVKQAPAFAYVLLVEYRPRGYTYPAYTIAPQWAVEVLRALLCGTEDVDRQAKAARALFPDPATRGAAYALRALTRESDLYTTFPPALLALAGRARP